MFDDWTPGRHPNRRDTASLPVELRRAPVTAQARAWVERTTGRSVVRVRRLLGASTSAVHGVYLSDGTRLVLRRYAWPSYLESEPLAPRREVDALQFGRLHGLAIPELIAADLGTADVGDGIPAVLMSFLPGRAVGVPDLHRLAEAAATVHAVDASTFPHEYFSWYSDVMRDTPANATRPELWLAAIDTWRTRMPTFEPRLIHRDFHPGNVLWNRGRLSGVVDWPNACRGPWGCDLAHCRWNLMQLADLETADAFTSAYEAVTGRTYDPFWEIAQEMEQEPGPRKVASIRRSEARLARALTDLGISLHRK